MRLSMLDLSKQNYGAVHNYMSAVICRNEHRNHYCANHPTNKKRELAHSLLIDVGSQPIN